MTISKKHENVTPCDKDENKNYLKNTLFLHLFQHKVKFTWLDNELGQ